MADLELRPPPFAQARSHAGGGPGPSTHPRTRSRNNPRHNPSTPSEGQNAEEPIMIGSSDEENEDERPLAAAGRSIAEQRARMHNNRTGTPIPRAPEVGLRVFSPPPMPNLHHLRYLQRRPDWPHQHLDGAMQQRLFTSGFMPRLRTPEGQHFLQRILGNDGFGRILGMAFGPDYMNHGGRAEPGAPAAAEEYDVRMTHASAKPRIGFSYDFAPDEDEENAAMEAAKPATPQVRTRTTIIIPDSPPHVPVDRKGKGRARDEDLDEYDILDLDPEESKPRPRMVVPSPGSSSSRGKKRKRQAVEIVEVLSDDESDAESGHASGSGSVSVAATAPVSQAPPPDKIRTVLVCASCRRPLKTGGDRLWALRCGHLIDSRCYRKLAERPIVPEDIPVLGESDASPTVARTARGNKRRKVSGGRGKGKGKDKAPVPPVPQVVESIEWTCPVNKCRRVHWSERVSTGGVSAWQPMKETGAIAVFV